MYDSLASAAVSFVILNAWFRTMSPFVYWLVYACGSMKDSSRLHLRGFVGAPDGSRVVSGAHEGSATDPEALGTALAERLRAEGAADILARLQDNR